MEKLLPTHYFLLTITLPQGLRKIARSHLIIPGGTLSEEKDLWLSSGQDLFVHTKPLTNIFKANLIELQKILGHVGLLTTAKYTHLTAATQNNSHHTINKVINGFSIGWGGVK